jgi:hypothetical protein
MGKGTVKDIASAIPIYTINQAIDDLLKLLKLLFLYILVNSPASSPIICN